MVTIGTARLRRMRIMRMMRMRMRRMRMVARSRRRRKARTVRKKGSLLPHSPRLLPLHACSQRGEQARARVGVRQGNEKEKVLKILGSINQTQVHPPPPPPLVALPRFIPHVHHARPLNEFENSPNLAENRIEYVLLTT